MKQEKEKPVESKEEAPTLEGLAKENATIKSMIDDLKSLIKANTEGKKFEAPKQQETKANDWEGIE